MSEMVEDYEVVLEESESPFKGVLNITYKFGVSIRGYRLFKYNDGKIKVKEPKELPECVCIREEALHQASIIWEAYEIRENYRRK